MLTSPSVQVQRPVKRTNVSEPFKRTGSSANPVPFVAAGVIVAVVGCLLWSGYSGRPAKDNDSTENMVNYAEEESEETALPVETLIEEPEESVEEPDVSEEEEFAEEDTEEEYVEEDTEEEAEEEVSQYFLPTSSSEYLTMSDIEGFSQDDCRLARNELYARHGRRFDDPNLQAYFDACDWYEGTVEPADFDDSVMNEYEIANRDLIVQYEKNRGYR